MQDSNHIRYVFVLNLSDDPTLYTFGVLTDKYEYQSTCIRIKQVALTNSTIKSIKSIIANFNIDSHTEVIFSKTAKDTALYSYFSIIRTYLNFKFSSVKIEQAFRRIVQYHRSYLKHDTIQQSDYNKLYKKILVNDDCLWITKEQDAILNNVSRAEYRIQKILRICMYYMCIRRYFSTLNRKVKK